MPRNVPADVSRTEVDAVKEPGGAKSGTEVHRVQLDEVVKCSRGNAAEYPSVDRSCSVAQRRRGLEEVKEVLAGRSPPAASVYSSE